jgi:pyrroline-5-carboxylate reductase
MTTPILMLGAGRMGGAMVQGWLASRAFAASDLILRDPHPGEAALAAAANGARLNPPDADLAAAPTVVLAVKPQIWREAAAIGQGTASIFARDPAARARAHALFAPLGTVVDIAEEDLMHAATAVSGSAPAYLYAFLEALEAAGVDAGLTPEAASRLARSTITGAAALLAKGGEDPAELRRQVTSPGGVTQAALEVLMAEAGFPGLMRAAAAAAIRRSKELGG